MSGKIEEAGTKVKNAAKEGMTKAAHKVKETATQASNRIKEKVHCARWPDIEKEMSETSLFLPQYFGERPPPGTYAGMRMPESPETLRMKSGCAGSQTIICSG